MVYFCLFERGNDRYRYRYRCVGRVVYLIMIINKREKRKKRKEYYGNNGHYNKKEESKRKVKAGVKKNKTDRG